MRWKKTLYWGTACGMGILMGVLSLFAVLASAQFTTDTIGPWRYNTRIGVPATTPYWRATIAIIGFLALPKEESMYFNAMEDDEGRLLRGGCTYRIEVPELPCRWWSLTLYNKAGYLIDNEENRYSFNGEQLERNAEGNYVFYVSPTPQDGHWIPTSGAAYFDLTLRLYNPKEAFWEGLHSDSLMFPRIIKEGCSND